MKKTLLSIDALYSVLLSFPVALFTIIFVYTLNISEVSFNQLIKPSLLFIAVSLISWLFFLIVTRKPYISTLLTDFTLIFLLNYSVIEEQIRSITYSIRYWHIIIGFAALLVTISILSRQKSDSSPYARKFAFAVFFIFTVLSLYNFIIATPVLINKISVNKEIQHSSSTNKQADKLPNVYFIILDEYSSFEVINKHYTYSNNILLDFFHDNKFNVSLSSYNNSSATNIVTGNLLALDNVLYDGQPAEECYAIRNNSELFNYMKNCGFNTYAIDNANLIWPTTWNKLNADFFMEQESTMSIDSFTETLMKKTFFGLFINPDTNFMRRLIKDSFSYISNISAEQESNTFVYAHILSPHQPFIFDKLGQNIPINKSEDWKDKSLYLGQYQYITKIVMDTISLILKNDEDCIIILQSDHSARYTENISEAEKNSILNAVYYQGDTLEIEGLSGLDTLKKAINLFSN